MVVSVFGLNLPLFFLHILQDYLDEAIQEHGIIPFSRILGIFDPQEENIARIAKLPYFMSEL